MNSACVYQTSLEVTKPSVNGQIVNIFSSVGHIVSDAIIQVFHCSTKTARDNIHTTMHDVALKSLYSDKTLIG